MSNALRHAFVALALLASLAGPPARADETELPFAVDIPEGWMKSVLPGVSSAPQDRELGLRQRAQWIGADGTASMEFTCMWLRGTPDVPKEIETIADALADGVRANGMTFEGSERTDQRHGSQTWRGFVGSMGLAGETIGRQRVLVRAGERCFLSATLAGTPEAYALQEPVFERALAGLRELPER